MSAWIVSRSHINAMVWTWDRLSDIYTTFPERVTTLDELGQLLWEENHKSVNDRYEDSNEETPEFHYRRVMRTEVPPDTEYHQHSGYSLRDVAVMLKNVSCYEYQTCQHEGWETSTAKAICATLRDMLIRSLPGYDNAPWGIDIEESDTA